MHWLSAELARVEALATGGHSVEFLSTVDTLVSAVAGRPGIDACFAAYEGLLVARAGQHADFEALAATSQRALDIAESPGSIGRLRQMVMVGDTSKLALIRLGNVLLGILSAIDVGITDATA